MYNQHFNYQSSAYRQYNSTSSVSELQQPSSLITSQAIYQTLIRQTPNLYPLSKFKLMKQSSNKQLYPDALKYPQFFNYNLVSPGRVIKKLTGQNSCIRGFYYQLMKLGFEIEIEEKDYIQIIKNIIFSPQFMLLEENSQSPSSGKNYSDLQYKKIIAQFMELLMNQTIPNFELTILNYPVVDQALIKILQNLLKFKESSSVEKSAYQKLNNIQSNSQILQELSRIFECTMVQYGNCYKFQQSDIFLYEQDSEQYYIAFLNEMAEISDGSYESSKRSKLNARVNQNQVLNHNQVGIYTKMIGRSSQANKYNQGHRNQYSQFELQTPSRQSSRQYSSYLTDNKYHYNDIDSDHNIQNNKYRNTYGYTQNRSYRVNSQKYPEPQNTKNDKNLEPLEQDEYQTNLENDSIENVQMIESHSKYESQQKSLIHLPEPKININISSQIIQTNNSINLSSQSIISPPQKIHQQNHSQSLKIQSIQYIPNNNYLHSPFSTVNKPIPNNYEISNHKSTNKLQSSPFIMNAINSPLLQSAKSDEVIGYTSNMIQSNTMSISGNKNLETTIGSNNYINNNLMINTVNSNIMQPIVNNNILKIGNKIQKQSSSQDSIHILMNKKSDSSKNSDEELFYKPSNGRFQVNYNNINNNINVPSYQNNNIKTSEEFTLYKQFTQTIILDMLPQKIQNNICTMKRKFKGMHSKDLYKNPTDNRAQYKSPNNKLV